MLLSVGLAALVPYAILISVSIVFAYRTVSGDAYRYAGAMSEHYANEIAARLNLIAGQGKSLASAFSSFSSMPPSARRTIISAELKAAIEAQPELLAAWAQWEKGAIGDDPRAYAHTLLTTESGAFNATWYRAGKDIRQGWISDGAYKSDFYVLPKLSRRTTLIEPYRYSYTGSRSDEILETSLCFPIISGGTFLGVVGFDFPVELFSEMVPRVKPFATGYGVIVTGSGTIVGHPIDRRIGRPFAEGEIDGERRSGFLRLLDSGSSFTFDKPAAMTGEDSRFCFSPVRVAGVEKPWFFALVAPRARILAPARMLALVLVGLGATGAIVVASSILVASRSLARPIADLAEGARRISERDLSYRVPIEGATASTAEVSALASSFNEMADKLRSTLAGLESKVEERTASLEGANAELERTLADLKAAQAGLELSAKMALLGRLTAGISHELNTPIGAIRSSASSVLGSVEDFVELFLPAYASFPQTDRELFYALFDRGRKRASSRLGSEDRRRKTDLTQRLQAEGVDRAHYVADAISTLDAFDLEREVVACAARGSWIVVAAAERAVETRRSAAVIIEAAEKAARTVSALANYSRSEGLDSLEPLRPAEEIEELLTLHYNRIKRSVRIERNFACRDPVLGYRERLAEVWMNLIDNALQAMDYKGKLGVSTARDGPWIVVSISDTGPGIPEELRTKVFTPFFTTKAPGEGLGLGLDICRRIVERHGGSLSFASGRDGCVFSVKLRAAPGTASARPPAEAAEAGQ